MKGTVIHPVIGEVTVSRTRRATRISLSVRPDGSVRLSYPAAVSHKRAMRFLNEKSEWIVENRRKIEERYKPAPLTESYSTRCHALHFERAEVEKISVRIKDGVIIVKHPSAAAQESEEVQYAAGKGIMEALRVEAKKLLPAMVERLASEHGFRYGNVRVKASRSKWGSCTAHNDINLSLFLMLLPDRLIEYVVLHELCHTVHKDHSARFHTLLDKVTQGGHRALNRELRAHRPDIANRQPKNEE